MRATEEIKQKTDIVEVISPYTTLTKAGRVLKGLCPFHSEKHASFIVYPEQQSWHCFGACNSGGDVFSFIMKKEGLDFGEALRLLAERAGISLPSRFEPRADRDEQERLYQVNAAAARYFNNLLLNSPSAQKARDYIARRGLSAKSITDFQLGYSPNSWQALNQYLAEQGYNEAEIIAAGLIIKADDGRSHDRFRNMLMFPICDMKGRVCGFGARVLDDSQPKYVNSPQTTLFDKSAILYGLNLAAADIRRQDRAVIVEGYTDVITAHQNGFSNVVASMGTSVTERQISSLKRLTRNIVFALDADAAGGEATLRGTAFENTLNAEVKVIILPKGKDPDDVIRQDPKNWQQLLDSAPPIIDYTFDRAASGLDLNTTSGKAKITSLMFPIIAKIKDTLRLDHYTHKLALLRKTEQKKVEGELSKFKLDQKRKEAGKTSFAAAAITPSRQPLLTDSLEEGCLTLLLKHPELKSKSNELLAEHFEYSENREIFIAYQQTEDISSLKTKLDAALHQHLDDIMNKKRLNTGVGQEYVDFIVKLSPAAPIEHNWTAYALLLREKFQCHLAAQIAEILASADNKGSTADLIKFKEQGMEVGLKRKELFIQKEKWHREKRR